MKSLFWLCSLAAGLPFIWLVITGHHWNDGMTHLYLSAMVFYALARIEGLDERGG